MPFSETLLPYSKSIPELSHGTEADIDCPSIGQKSDRERKSDPSDWWPTKNHTASLQLRRFIGILSQILLQFFGLIILRISMMSLTHSIVYTTSSFAIKIISTRHSVLLPFKTI